MAGVDAPRAGQPGTSDAHVVRAASGREAAREHEARPKRVRHSRQSVRRFTSRNQLCRERGLYHISDEAYEYFVYDGAEHFSPGSLEGAAGHTISLYSLSKAYGFASWRVGCMVIPEPLTMAIRKAQDTILICPPVISQAAAVGALAVGLDYCRPQLARLAQVRQGVLDELGAVRAYCTIPAARGAFYFLLHIDTPLDSMSLAERLIREFGVAVIPGATFGMDRGCYLRVAYGSLAADTIREGIGRLVRGLNSIVRG